MLAELTEKAEAVIGVVINHNIFCFFFFFQAEDGIRDLTVTGVQTCALPISLIGTGVTISGDYAHPNADYGKGNTWGGRASLGIGTLTLTAGVASWKPDLATESFTSIGGNAAFRLIGGSLLPFSLNLQVGAARTDSANSTPAQTAVTGAMGFSVPLPTPGISIEPYFSPGLRYRKSGSANTTQFGYVFGANLSFGLVGLHLAYDNERR